jgi:hypothetical protein
MMRRKTSLNLLACHTHKSATGSLTSASVTGESNLLIVVDHVETHDRSRVVSYAVLLRSVVSGAASCCLKLFRGDLHLAQK